MSQTNGNDFFTIVVEDEFQPPEPFDDEYTKTEGEAQYEPDWPLELSSLSHQFDEIYHYFNQLQEALTNPTDNIDDQPNILTLDQINLIPTMSYQIAKSAIKNNIENCPICLEAFNDQNSIKLLSCYHIYHINCITKWLSERSEACPMCRKTIKN